MASLSVHHQQPRWAARSGDDLQRGKELHSDETKKSRCDQLVILPTPPFEKDLAFLRRFVPLLKLDNARGQDWLTKYCIIFLVDKKFLEWVPFQRGVRTGIQKENSIMTTILEGSTILEESSLWCEYSFDFRYKTNHL